MLTLSVAQVHRLTVRIFVGAGAPPDLAAQVADVLTDNHLAGYDSHGVLRIPDYVSQILHGKLVPTARPAVLRETAATALISGNWTFGQVAANFATDLLIEKALSEQVAAVSIVKIDHTGRLAAFTTRAARRGVVMFMVSGSGRKYSVAPYGGRAPALGTNAMSFSVPNGSSFPVTLDYATSSIAAGKVKVARANKQQLPPGAAVTKDGLPTTDPEALLRGGFLMPFGGHKGYALSVIVELLSGPLTGADEYAQDAKKTGVFMFAVHAGAFRSLEAFTQTTAGVVERLNSVPPAVGFDGVLVPGQLDARSRQLREKQGIPVPDTIWEAISAAASDLGIDPDSLLE